MSSWSCSTGRLIPDFKTIADFRKDNGEAIHKVCRAFVLLCRRLNLLGDASVAIDGSKFKAVNNRDKNFTGAKMKRRLEQIDQSIARYLSQLDTADRCPASAPYHPMTQGKIERWHQTLKNRILLENYYLPGDLEAQIEAFVVGYNHLRYHESIGNLTPADVYFGRGQTILIERERIKRQTIANRRLMHSQQAA